MKIILSESQYNRLFNNKKRKLVITENQYKKLLIETVEFDFNKIRVGNIIKITKNNDDLHFRVISKDYNYIIMINCNDGVYKNAYFFVDKNSFSNGSLRYKSGQSKDIDEKTPNQSLIKNGRDGVFKNITNLEIYDDGQTTGCNLSNNAKKLFTLDVDTGNFEEPNKEGKSVGDNTNVDPLKNFKDELFTKKLKPDAWYKVIFHDDSSFKINSIEQSGGFISIKFQELNGKPVMGGEVDGYALRWLKPLADSDEYEKATNISINIDDIKAGSVNKENGELETFDIPIVLNYTVDGDSKSKKFMFNGVKEIEPIKGDESFKGGVDKEGEIPRINISDEKMLELLNKLVTNSKFLNNAIVSKPNKVLELLGLARKKGILPAEGRLSKWGIYTTNRANKSIMLNKFKINSDFSVNFESYKILDKKNSPNIKTGTVFKVKSLKPKENDKYHKLGTNFNKEIKLEENFKYSIYLIKELEEHDNFYVYQVELFYKSVKNEAGVKIGTGKLQILKNKEVKK